MKRRNHDVQGSLDYIQTLFAPEDPLLSQIRHRLINDNLAINIGAEEGKLLQVLIQLSQTKTIIEIGTLYGYSTLWMARALPEDGHVYTFEFNPQHSSIAKQHFEASDVNDKITLIEGKALDMLSTIAAKGPFDMAFIDADKRGYVAYLDWCEKNIRKDGLIIGDNTFLFGAVYQDELPHAVKESTKNIMHDFNSRLSNPEKYSSIIIPTEQGMTVAQKKF